jgi:hypothetical protein
VSQAAHRLPSRSRSTVIAALVFALCALGLGVASATAEPPQVTTPEVSEVSYATAHVKGKVDAKGEGTNWFFEVSTDGINWERTNVGGFREDSGLQPVGDEDITNLKPGTTYQVRLSAENGSGFVSSPEPNPEFTTKSLPTPTVTIDPVTTFDGATATFSGTINPNSPVGNPAAADVNWHFQCSPECPSLSLASGSAPNPIPADNSNHAVSVEAAGLEPNTTYDVTLVGQNAGDPVEAGPVSFKTDVVAPEAETIPAFALAGGVKAQLGGRINPRNSATTYWFEYGTTTSYGTAVPATEDGNAGSGPENVVVSREVSGLAPGTTYHYRVVADSAASGPVHGEDLTFRTPSSAPVQPSPGSCPNEQFRVGNSAGLPDCRAYELVTPPDLGGSSVRSVTIGNEGVTSEFSAVASEGNALLWSTDAVLPGDPSNGSQEYYVARRGVNGWSSKFLGPPGNAVNGSSFLEYATDDLEHILFQTHGSTLPGDDGPPVPPDQQGTIYTDLYREEPDGSLVHVNVGSQPEASVYEAVGLEGISADGMKILFTDSRSLEPGTSGVCTMYLRSGNVTEIVSRDESNLPVTTCDAAISEDGSVVVFGDYFGDNLYVRDLEDGQTAHIATSDASNHGLPGFLPKALAADGTRLVLTAGPQLTPDDEDSRVDLYEYDLATEAFTRLSAASGSSASSGNADQCGGSSCDVRFIAATKDATGVYFVSPELLDGDKGVEGEPNIYLRRGGQTTYVATGETGDVRVTADQSTLLFESKARISAYDNEGVNEIYAFDSTTSDVTCVSCSPQGGAPSGAASLKNWPATYIGQFVGPGVNVLNADAHAEHFFFQTADALDPADTNGKVDVYEYDVASATPLLLSSGSADSDTAYWGNSADGRDVFLATIQSLTVEDRSVDALKVYDARVGGGFPIPVTPAPCQGEGCRAAGSPLPPAAEPTTSSFQGPGNPKPKHKGKRHRKKHKHHKHKGHGKKKHGSHKRGASHHGRTSR